jgi:hypothetical protein
MGDQENRSEPDHRVCNAYDLLLPNRPYICHSELLQSKSLQLLIDLHVTFK